MEHHCQRGLPTHGSSWQLSSLTTLLSLPAQIEMIAAGPRGRGSSASVGEGAAAGGGGPPGGGAAGSQGPMLHFFTKLRRHASLEGASPYFKIKKWKLDSSQRASSLDTRGEQRLLLKSLKLLSLLTNSSRK